VELDPIDRDRDGGDPPGGPELVAGDVRDPDVADRTGPRSWSLTIAAIVSRSETVGLG
jgi:hypothetical protein